MMNRFLKPIGVFLLSLVLCEFAVAQSGWFSQTSGTTNTLPGVSFADANNGWVVGGTGSSSTILRTTDGGFNWSSQSSTVSQLLNSVHAIDAVTAVAVGNSGTILRTTDGGANWSSITSSTTNSLLSVNFSDASNGWAVGTIKTIRRTATGGASWFTQSVSLGSNGHFRGVASSSSSVVTAVGSTSNGLTQLRIRTTNGGTNWSGQVDGTVNGIVYGVSFGDANTGLIVGQPPSVFKTTNAGSGWSSLASPTAYTLYAVDMADANTAYVVGEFGSIFKTTDGGSNWANQSTGSSDLRGVHFSDAMNGTAVGSGGTILRTTTGGAVTTITVSKSGDYTGSGISPGSADVPVLQLEAASAFGTAFISSVGASFKSGSSVADGDISSFKVYHDADNSGTVSGGDLLLGSGTFSGGNVNVTGLSFPVTTAGEKLLLAVDVDASADPAHTFAVEMTGSGSLTSINATSTGFPISNSSESALPVEISSFTAVVRGSAVELAWTTATEVNNYGFEVERASLNPSKGGTSETPLPFGKGLGDGLWGAIGFVEGAGTSNLPKEYSFTDLKLKAGRYSYRLKQIDVDGKFVYFQTVEAEIAAPKEFALYQNFPNPFNPTTTISFSIPDVGTHENASPNKGTSFQTSLRVYDMLGREVATLVNEEMKAGAHSVQFDASRLSTGMYIYTLRAGNFVASKKLLLMK